MKIIKRILCFLMRHDIQLNGSQTDETLYYRCRRCGQTWPYYF